MALMCEISSMCTVAWPLRLGKPKLRERRPATTQLQNDPRKWWWQSQISFFFLMVFYSILCCTSCMLAGLCHLGDVIRCVSILFNMMFDAVPVVCLFCRIYITSSNGSASYHKSTTTTPTLAPTTTTTITTTRICLRSLDKITNP